LLIVITATPSAPTSMFTLHAMAQKPPKLDENFTSGAQIWRNSAAK
jgi:hypothetical protein